MCAADNDDDDDDVQSREGHALHDPLPTAESSHDRLMIHKYVERAEFFSPVQTTCGASDEKVSVELLSNQAVVDSPFSVGRSVDQSVSQSVTEAKATCLSQRGQRANPG